MAYRVVSDCGTCAPRGRGDRALTRSVLLTGVAFSCVALLSAGAALFGSPRDFAAAPNDSASRGALRIALVDPAPQPVVKRDPRIPIDTSDRPLTAKVIAQRGIRTDAAQRDRQTTAQPGKGLSIPLPLARPTEIASIPPSPERRIDNAATGSLGRPASETAVASAAPTRETPTPPARPRVLTPHEKLYGPVRVAALTPAATMPDTGARLPRAPYDRQTAVYVITDKTVYMPDGRALEAHSGFGRKMDDPRFVHVRMRGATPPHVYDLTVREALFHGVEAIRLTPIGGERAIFGRNGLLAHTYLLGPNGQSNGCVSFKNYGAFLKAFKAGKITRLAVLARLD